MIRSDRDLKALRFMTAAAIGVVASAHANGAVAWLIMAVLVIVLELTGHALPWVLAGGLKSEGRRWVMMPRLRHAVITAFGLSILKLLTHSGQRELVFHVLLPSIVVVTLGFATYGWIRKKVILRPPKFERCGFNTFGAQMPRSAHLAIRTSGWIRRRQLIVACSIPARTLAVCVQFLSPLWSAFGYIRISRGVKRAVSRYTGVVSRELGAPRLRPLPDDSLELPLTAGVVPIGP